MNNQATLVYKCRLCGGFHKSTHVPHGTLALLAIMHGVPRPSSWFGPPLAATDSHICRDGRVGVTDFAGYEYDEPR